MPDLSPTPFPRPSLGPRSAEWLVFFASGAVLMLEILALRLVAPYVGLSLETSSAVIGFALAAIAAGAWIGGRVADSVPPQRVLGPCVLLSGALVLLIGPTVRWSGEQLRSGVVSAVLLLGASAVFVPAALLSAVTPLVVKLRLNALAETGSVVGRLSGIGTLGALVSTFATGFLLVAAAPTSVILLVLGVVLSVLGSVLTIKLRGVRAVAMPLLLALGAGGISMLSPEPCDVETAYHCARVVADPARPTGRTLHLDTLRHSYVDLDDPTYLEFAYIKGIAAAVQAVWPAGNPLDALHVGGGGVTFPRYLAATRPGSNNLVLEIDGGVIDLDKAKLGLRPGPGLQVRIQDARIGLAEEPTNNADLVVGDAFGGLSVPWHLTTVETVREIQRVLRSGGLYAVNVIDYSPLEFARAEVKTVSSIFRHTAVISYPPVLRGLGGGNLVILGSDAPLPIEQLTDRLAEMAPVLSVLSGPRQIGVFAGDTKVLSDDFAPVDQLLTPSPQN